MKKIFVHGMGHKAASWEQTVSRMKEGEEILCPELSALLGEKPATYGNLYASFAEYCNGTEGKIHLCGLSLGGVLALNYALDYPEKVSTLALIGTPCKIPRAAFAVQNFFFRFLPKSLFRRMAFDKKNTFILGNSMKKLDFSDRVQNIGCPTLIVCGENDDANKNAAEYMSRNIKGAVLKMLAYAGHVVSEENPEGLAKILDEFYDSVPVCNAAFRPVGIAVREG